MKALPTVALVLVRVAALPLVGAEALAAAPRPNLVLILADDMGYSDLGCFGSEIATPSLDTLAANGVRFTQFYNSARCCPTRASLLTGLHPHQAGIGHMVEDRGFDAYRGDLSRRSVTLAEVLKPAGYRSYAVGKWHVTRGKTPEALARKQSWPLQRGFDRYYGTINGSGSFWDPHSLVRDNREVTIANDPEYQPAEYYYTDAISDHATRFISEHAREHASDPLLLYVAYTAAHWPMHARERDIARQRGRYGAGYGPTRGARWVKQQLLGVVRAAWDLAPPAEDWGRVENREFEARGMEVYAAIPAGRRGRLEAQPGHVIDVMATLVDVAGASYPSQFNGQPIQPMEGVSLRPALAGDSPGGERPLFWEHEGNRAIRLGSWKLVSRYPAEWELYDVGADRTERHDLAAQQPERVRQLAGQWEAWAKRVGVQPWDVIRAAAPPAATNTKAKLQ